MNEEFLFHFLILSASLNALMVVLKRIKQIKDHSIFNTLKPIIPPVAGLAAGPFVFADLPIVTCLLAGFLAGTLCTTSYQAFRAVVKKEGEYG
jgi:hypothetical protein